MIAAQMLYLSIVGLLIASAAAAAEFVAIRIGVARRGIWLAAIVVMCGMPFAPVEWTARWLRPVTLIEARVDDDTPISGARHTAVRTPSPTGPDVTGREPLAARFSATSALVRIADRTQTLDTPLSVLWILVSLSMLLVTIAKAHRLTRLRSAWQLWKRDTFSRPTMFLSEDVGPAAFGVGRSEIVVPRWALALPSADRHLLLAHERAHVEARDPLLLALGRMFVIAVPWHLPLRWASRRLQRAIEHDCDRRVLHRRNSARRYADLLLLVTERGMTRPSRSTRVLGLSSTATSMTALFDGAPELESRLRFLIAPAPTVHSCFAACTAAGGAALLLVAACAVPMPRRPVSPEPARTPRSLATLAVTRDPAWLVRTQNAASSTLRRSAGDSAVFARDDSLVIDAIAQSEPSLLMLAATPTPFVAIAINESNEVVAHSIRAGAPVRPLRDSMSQLVRASDARRIDASTPRNDDEFQGRLSVVANMPARYLDSLGISHLQVGDRALTVLWMRFKPRAGD